MSDERVLPTASQEAWEKARKLNELGKILEGWDVLAGEGDKYAEEAAEFVGGFLFSLLGTRADAQKHQKNYLMIQKRTSWEMNISSLRRITSWSPTGL